MEPFDHPQKRRRETFLSLFLAFVMGGGFFLFMVLITGGFFLYVLGAVLAIGGVGLIHYFLWGHALTMEVAGEREEEEARERWEAEQTPAAETLPRRRF
jgi:uncharacterized membrane protein HdeD (DUF308 family)